MAAPTIPIIDSHVHILQPARFHYHWLETGSWLDNDFGLTAVREEMKNLGVVGGILMEATNTPDEIPWLLDICESDDLCYGVIGWVHLEQADAPAQIAHFARNPHFKGVRLNWIETRARTQSLDESMEAISALKLVVDVLPSWEHLPDIAAFMRAHPQVSFVLEHLGGMAITETMLPTWEAIMERFADLPNVAVKISGCTPSAAMPLRAYVETAVKLFSSRRLMFGSNYPICLNTATYTKTVACLQAATIGLSKSARTALCFETAQQIYHLS